MIKSTLLLVFTALVTCISGQEYKDSVKTQFSRYLDHLVKKEFKKSTDYMNAGLFKIVTKEQLVIALEKVYNNPEIEFNIENPSVISIDDIREIDSTSYVKLKYANYLVMKFVSKHQDTALTKKALEAQFGVNNVKYDTATEFYRIFIVKDVIANSNDNHKWTFAVVEDRQKPLLEKFIPKELL